MTDRVRTFAGYRKYHGYGMISRSFAYEQALLREVERLVHNIRREVEDVFYLRFEEFWDVVLHPRHPRGLHRASRGVGPVTSRRPPT
ncbi:hypothetical protein [Actinomadura citrea]|uniref:Uncharacterized protein n=1 Tax=Actinomadura citrea TaxID=46158 RepID=A0A7Y9GE09_9ACTN|nr:hypothetical protein [Actinomadura citrea]NYE14775.1 hypothetical protein [Actinomadura citrea]